MVASFILLIALAAMPLLRNRSAALRHWVLAGAILCAAVAPLLRPLAPAWNINPGLSPAATVVQPPTPSRPSSPTQVTGVPMPIAPVARNVNTTAPFGLERFLLLTWAIGAAFSLCLLLAGFVRLSRRAVRAERLVDGRAVGLLRELSHAVGLSRPVTLIQSDAPNLPVTWGFVRPTIMLPVERSAWPNERLRVVLLHELAHIQRGDWLTQLAAEGVRAIYWFNPLAWLVVHRLRQESEQACDDTVLNGGVNASDYASHLLALARSAVGRRTFTSGYSAPAMARPSSLERRFTAMLNHRLDRTPVTRAARVMSAAFLLMVTLFAAGFGAQTFSTFSGTVVDATNRVVPGVTISLVNTQSQAKHEVTTDATGNFELVGLPPAEYTWQAALNGFARLSGKVTIAGRDVQQNLALQVGLLVETITVRGGGTSAASSGPDLAKVEELRQRRSAAPCTAGPTGGTIKAPVKLADVRPRYPEHLNATKVGGVVVLNIVVDSRGDVKDVSVARSPNPELEFAAVEAVRQWKYSATTLNCEPVDMRMSVSVNFASQP